MQVLDNKVEVRLEFLFFKFPQQIIEVSAPVFTIVKGDYIYWLVSVQLPKVCLRIWILTRSSIEAKNTFFLLQDMLTQLETDSYSDFAFRVKSDCVMDENLDSRAFVVWIPTRSLYCIFAVEVMVIRNSVQMLVVEVTAVNIRDLRSMRVIYSHPHHGLGDTNCLLLKFGNVKIHHRWWQIDWYLPCSCL